MKNRLALPVMIAAAIGLVLTGCGRGPGTDKMTEPPVEQPPDGATPGGATPGGATPGGAAPGGAAHDAEHRRHMGIHRLLGDDRSA